MLDNEVSSHIHSVPFKLTMLTSTFGINESCKTWNLLNRTGSIGSYNIQTFR